ncbi:MAG TPA: Ig-like domain-containing protein [Bryobacteraceae bacterium]|nr:Ig-like domain-containing protein [Bryobacteraceae bacterium]
MTTRTVQLTTNIGGGNQEIASKASAFTVTAGNATITSATPTSPATIHQNDSGDIITIIGSNTHFTLAALTNASVVFCNGISTAAVTVNSDTKLTVTVNVSTFAPAGACGVTVTTGGEVATGTNLFNILAGLPIITQVSPNTAHQGDQNVTVNIAGLYTHFTSGAVSVAIPGGTLAGAVTPNSDTSATAVFNFSAAAATGAQTVTVSDTTDGSLNDNNAFTIVAGVPALISAVPNTMGQGVTQNVTLTGQFTHFTAGSVVTISGTQVTAGAVLSTPAPTSTQIVVPITVQAGASAGNRTITVTTGAEVVQLANGFTVQAGVPNITQISPNIGVPNSVVPVTITGIFTSWVSGTTTVSFGPQITVTPTNISATSITANLNIPNNATLGPVNVVVTTGAQILTVVNGFTVQNTTTTAPVVTFVSPTNSATGVPINSQVSVTFSEPLNPATIPANGANAFISDGTSQGGCWQPSGAPATVALDVSGRILTITPTNPLGVGRTFYLQLNSYSVPGSTPTIADQSGNALGHYCYSFTAGFAPDNNGPTFLSANIPAGATNVATNVPNVELGFDKPINPATQAAGLSVTTGGNPVAGVWSYSSDFTKSFFTPNSAFVVNTTYLVTYTAAVTGQTGVALTNPGSFSFTTGAGTDNTGGTYISWTPPQGVITPTTGTNPTIRFVYNKPVNPMTVTPGSFYVYNQTNGVTVTGTTVSWSADFKTFTLHLPGSLLAGTSYRWVVSGASDWLGNGFSGSVVFTTSTAQDTTAPTVLTVSPGAAISCGGNPCAPVNSEVQIQFSELMDPTSLATGAVVLTPTSPSGPAVPGKFSFSADGSCTTPSSSGSCNFSLLTFTPSTNLNVNTTYQISIPDGQLADLNGNFDPFSSSFTTGSSSTADTTHGSITSITPSSGATNIPLNTNVVVQLNKVVDPLTVNSTSFRVYDNTGGVNVPGTITVSANQQTLTFAQTLPFEPNHQICVYASYYQSFYDLAGNYFNGAGQCFTTGAGSDTTVPTVISATPLNNATGIGANNPVMVTFSKPMNPGTFSNNVAIYNGSTLFTQNYTYSSDGTTLIFSTGNMPFAAALTVVVSPNVTDLEGNHLATEFSSTFATMTQPVTTQPQVTAMRPSSGATGVAASNPITFFMSAPMNPATINASTLIVSQNGTAMTGSISVAADNQDVTFTPTGGSFTAGALVQVFFTNGATDASGNALVNFQSSFTIAPSLAGVNPTLISAQPCKYCGSADTTSAIDALFSKPLNPATVTGSNFFMSSSYNGTPLIAGTISLLDGGRLARFKPSSALSASACYYVFLTTGIQDTTGLSFAGGSNSYQYYVCTGSTSNAAPPSVSATAPTNGATGIGTNALVSVTFSENVDQLTLDPSNVTLANGANSIPLSIAYNSSTSTMTVTPQAPLPPSASVTLTLNGVSDIDGDALSPTPYTLSFNTGASPDYNAPVLLTSNITPNQTGVLATTSISLTFNKPIDMRSVVYGNTVVLQDLSVGGTVAAAVSPLGSNAILVTPSALLSVNHQYRVYYCSLADLNGNTTGCNFNLVFTTVLAAPSGGPVVTRMIPVNGTNPPVNFSPMVEFDRPVSPTSLGGVTLTQSGNPVTATPQLSAGGTILTLVPSSILSPSTAYTFTVTGVQDAAGNTMSGSVSRSFATGPSIELTNPVITLGSPIDNSTTGTNPEILFTFNEQINPISSSSFTFYNANIGGFVSGSALSWAPDFKSVMITYPGTLSPGTRYYFYLSSICNLANNCTGSSGHYLYTGSSADTGPESITGVNPPNGGSGVPLNPAISLVLSKPVAVGSVNNSSVTLSPAVPGTTISVSPDGLTLTLTLGSNLAASTPYTISVAAGAFTDQDDVGVSSFSSTFTTGISTEVNTTHGTISMTNPAPGATGVAITSSITVTFSQPLNPNSLGGSTFIVYENNNSNFQIAGTVTNPTPTTLVFTPAVALPPGQQINIYAGYYANITDYAGNTFNYLAGCCGGTTGNFTTASTADNTPPQVISFSPGVNATNVGPYAPVSLTFNKSLNVSTINSSNFAIYNGSTLLNVSPSYSGDRRTVTFNTSLPYNATIQVAVNTSVQDYAGNSMANSYTASFTTQAQPSASAPSVIQARPGNGAALNSPITLFMSAPMLLPAVQAGIFVAQNGVLVSGIVSLTADQRGIIWTPSANYQAGALIEVYLTSTATDTSGNPATAYKLSFTTQASAAGAPAETAISPCRYCSITYTNPVIDIQFSKALNPATVTSSTVQVTQGSGPGGTAIAGTVSLLNNNTMIRFTPSAPMPSNAYFYLSLGTGIQDTTSDAFAGDAFYVYVNSSSSDTTPPTVTSVTPINGSTGIGDNAPVRIVFSKVMDTLTINPTNVVLRNGSTPVPFTVTFQTINTPSQTIATLLPQSPLPDSTTINVKLTGRVTDLTGAAIAAQIPAFTTMAGADFTAPVVVSQSINNYDNANVPTNATFTWVMSKPLDPSTVVGTTSGFYVYTGNCSPTCYPPVNVNVAPDGRTITIVPQSNLPASLSSGWFYAQGATDLNGNQMNGASQFFRTAATANVTGPGIVATNPLSTNPNPVPTNTSIEVIFSAPVSATSLGSITLTGGANGPYTTLLNNGIYTDDTVVRIIPQSLLLPNTTYTVNVIGVTDIAGNAATTTTFSFTTSPNFETSGVTESQDAATITTGGGTVALPANTTVPNVLDSPTITVTFNEPIDYASLLHGYITLRNSSYQIINTVTLNYALSTDQKTATITTSGLQAATTYRLGVGYGVNGYDIAGNGDSGSSIFTFTTQ